MSDDKLAFYEGSKHENQFTDLHKNRQDQLRKIDLLEADKTHLVKENMTMVEKYKSA